MTIAKPGIYDIPADEFVLGEWVVQNVNACTCGMGDVGTYYGHEQYCGIEPVCRVTEWQGELPNADH